jgi:5'-nucleotidase
MREVAGVKFGIVGVATTDTPTSTQVANFRGLRLAPLAEAIDREAARLRRAGADVIVVVSHAGLCRKVDDVESVQHCDTGEIVDVLAQARERVDVVVAGHTHAGAVLRVGGTVITEAWKYGRGFGRVDVVFDRSRREIVHLELHQPRFIRAGDVYEGDPVVADPRVSAVIAPYVATAAAKRARRIGVRVVTPVRKSLDLESPFGNLSADLMRAARPDADVIVTNGGGLRKDLMPGDLTYGDLFEAFPFDNFFARVEVFGGELRRVFEANLATDRGILTMSGMRLEARCDGARLDVHLVRDDGRLVRDDERLVMVTSDFLASGGMDGALRSIDRARVIIEEGNLIREAMVAELARRGGVLSGGDRALLDPARPRIDYPGRRPVICGSQPPR